MTKIDKIQFLSSFISILELFHPRLLPSIDATVIAFDRKWVSSLTVCECMAGQWSSDCALLWSLRCLRRELHAQILRGTSFSSLQDYALSHSKALQFHHSTHQFHRVKFWGPPLCQDSATPCDNMSPLHTTPTYSNFQEKDTVFEAQIRVQHDDGEGQNKNGVGACLSAVQIREVHLSAVNQLVRISDYPFAESKNHKDPSGKRHLRAQQHFKTMTGLWEIPAIGTRVGSWAHQSLGDKNVINEDIDVTSS